MPKQFTIILKKNCIVDFIYISLNRESNVLLCYGLQAEVKGKYSPRKSKIYSNNDEYLLHMEFA